MNLLLLAVLGAGGVLVRYGLTRVWPSEAIPWAVLSVNVAGSFFAGLIYALKIIPGGDSSTWATLVLIGFLGGLTTFSSYSLDTMRLIAESSWGLALLNVALNNFLSLGACFLGLRAAALI